MSLSILSFLPAFDQRWKSMRAECDLATCHHTQLMRSIPGGKQGVQVGSQWYCCVDCFALASRVPLAALSGRRAVEMPRNPRLSLGLALHAKGFLSAEQLRTVSTLSRSGDEELAMTVIRLGLVTEKQVAAARASQWGCPALGQDHMGLMVQTDIPRAILNASGAVALHYSMTAKRILLGFVHRVEHSVLAPIEQMTGLRVEPCFITPSEFEEQSGRMTALPDYRESVIDNPGSPDRMARTVGRAAVDVGVREANFTSYKNLVWARVTGKRGKVDMIFRMDRVAEEAKPRAFEDFEDKVVNLG